MLSDVVHTEAVGWNPDILIEVYGAILPHLGNKGIAPDISPACLTEEIENPAIIPDLSTFGRDNNRSVVRIKLHYSIDISIEVEGTDVRAGAIRVG